MTAATTSPIRSPKARELQGQRAGIASRIAADAIDWGIVVAIYVGILLAIALAEYFVGSGKFDVPRPPAAVTLGAEWVIAVLYLTAGWAGTGPHGRQERDGAPRRHQRRAAAATAACVLPGVDLRHARCHRARLGDREPSPGGDPRHRGAHERRLRLDHRTSRLGTPRLPVAAGTLPATKGETMGIDREDPTLKDAVGEVARVWWVVLVIGIIFTGFGIVMLFNVAAGATTIAIIVGAFLIFDGLVEMISGGRRGGSRVWAVVLGILLVIGGIVVIAWPGVTFLVIAVVWGITLLVGGIARLVSAAMLRGYGWGWLVVLGILEAIVGIVMLAWPDVDRVRDPAPDRHLLDLRRDPPDLPLVPAEEGSGTARRAQPPGTGRRRLLNL